MENSLAKPIFGIEKGTCPPGTVPIRRTTKDDIIRVKSLLNNHILDQDNLNSHVVALIKELAELPAFIIEDVGMIKQVRLIYGLKMDRTMVLIKSPLGGM
ncbi:Neprosin activation peptide [Sesbania bispinosa]|nr:Neprosin activation peptide [Sesbania bispinosa]